MITLTTVFLVATVFAVFYYLSKDDKYSGKLLPGPKGFPLIGSIFSIGSKPYMTLGGWVKDYGPIFKLKLVNYKFLVISDPKLAREAYSKSALTGRPDFRVFTVLSGGNHGIINSSGKVWNEQRRFTLRTLRDFGFGKQTQLDMALEEVQDMVGWFKSSEGKPTLLEFTFDLSTVNSLWALITGKRFPKSDSSLQNFVVKSNEIFEKFSANPLAFFFPDFCNRFPKLTGWKEYEQNIIGFDKFITGPVEVQKKNYCPEDPPQDFAEACIQEISKTTDPESSFYKQIGETNKRVLIRDLFGAGSGTTSQTLSFSLLYLCKYTEIQQKIHEEIDRVVGRSRQPVLDDRKKMPYTEAFMFETLRKSSIVPFGLFHQATETTSVAGYTITEGTWVAVNLYHIHHDPAIWEDPENFRPERFLSDDGQTVVKNDALMPFSIGKRVCIGEQIAKDSFFLFLTGIMQRFQMKFDPNSPEPPSTGIPNQLFIVAPVFKVVVTDRIET